MVKCQKCKKQEASAFLEGKQLCQKCWFRLKPTGRAKKLSLNKWLDKYLKW